MTPAAAFRYPGRCQPTQERTMRVVLFHAIQRAANEIGTDYLNFCRQAQSTVKPTESCQCLAANVWLITSEDPLTSVDQLLKLARRHAINSKTLEFDLESQWQDHPSPA
jgi:hypothetical protein